MKKRILFIVAIMMGFITMSANPIINGGVFLPLRVKPIKPNVEQTPFPKSPVQTPEVYLDENVLSFDEAIEGCLVQLVDEDEDVVFADFIDENQTTLTLPSTLTGTYELQIITDSYIFYCEIDL